MKTSTFYAIFLTIIFIWQTTNAQDSGLKFKMHGAKSETITLNEIFTTSREIFPFDKNREKIYGLAVSADIRLTNEESVVRLILKDEKHEEYLVYEWYALLDGVSSVSVEELCEETAILDGVKANSLIIEITQAEITLNNLTFTTQNDPSVNTEQVKKEKKQQQNEDKINRLNQNLKVKNQQWVAGPTQVSELSYSGRKKLYGDSTFPPGFEYYAGGIISAEATETESSGLKSATASMYVDSWDWRNRHGRNWITPVVYQESCGSCWAFAAAGAAEAMVNLYYNQQLNPDLSEQDLISCSGGGSCSGGLPGIALDYIAKTGIVDEGAFPYASADLSCNNKSSSPSDKFKIGGRINFTSALYPASEDGLKKMIIEMGPISSGLYNWSHAMTLVGYQVVREGDTFYYRNLDLKRYWITVAPGDPLIGKTVWIFKNSWSSQFGDQGYVYVETPISNIGWTHGIVTPITSLEKNYQVNCEDKDGDGYYWWGLGPKPVTCNCPDEPDGDDSNPNLGPIDAYGNCRILTGIPTANFSVSATVVTEGETVNFTDLSGNAQSWSWTFEGGNPLTSSIKNPAVSYDTPGIYNVSLTVTNNNGYDTKTIENFLTVEQAEIISDDPVIIDKPIILDEETTSRYCTSKGNATEEWISSVVIGTQVHAFGSSGAAGYQDHTGTVFTAEAGTRINFTLRPMFSNKWQYEYWRIWIDYNRDEDFDDAGEIVFNSSQSKGEVSGSFTIPSGISGSTRMRIAMKRGSLPTACETFMYGEVEDYSIRIDEPLAQPPVAAFSADKTNVSSGGIVQFTDMSINDPTQWQWQFPGGNPSSSAERNPVVTYNSPGTYDVFLLVNKAGFEPSQESKLSFITVSEITIGEYCIPVSVNSTSDYIRSIVMENGLNTTTSGNGYSLTSGSVSLISGKIYNTSLTPMNSSNRNYWKVWIDINSDGDFNDAGETVLTINNKKGAVTSEITIPQSASGETRMRIAMRNLSAPEACGDNYEGDVKDFSVNISAAPQASIFTSVAEASSGEVSGVQLYPNPVTKNLVIITDDAGENDQYTLYNLHGGKLKSNKILTKRTTIDLSEHIPGIYFIVIENKNRIIREKIIKK